MDDTIFLHTNNKIKDIEKEHGVKILFAVESGSRAWGFESTDSDYDARFIYCHPKDWYIRILPKRDVIEYPIVDEYDYSGWDLQKAFFLMNKSNPVLFEWLRSPIVYYKEDFFYKVMTETAESYFSPISSVYHYLHMAKGNNREFLQGDRVKIKKYFYVLRPVLACQWIEKYNENPPVEFDTLKSLIDDAALLSSVNDLIERKRSGVELGLEPKIHIINEFIDEKLAYFEKTASGYDARKKPDSSYMDKQFLALLDHYNAAF